MNLDKTGQHYMIDKELMQFIVNYGELKNDDVVLEIGYGHGEITKLLAKKSHVVAIDIEKNDINIDGTYLKNITFYHGSILDEYEKLSKKHSFNKIISNIPYAISEPLMRKFFKSDFDLAILTMGKNFAQILSKADNRLGIIAQSFYDMEILKDVHPPAFSPQPRVDSAIIRIEPKPLDMLDTKAIIYKKLVMLDEKKLKNAFEKIFSQKTRKEIAQLCAKPLFKKKLFQLTNEEFMEVDRLLAKIL